MGIARTFAYGGKQGRLIYDPDNNKIANGEEYKKMVLKLQLVIFMISY